MQSVNSLLSRLLLGRRATTPGPAGVVLIGEVAERLVELLAESLEGMDVLTSNLE